MPANRFERNNMSRLRRTPSGFTPFADQIRQPHAVVCIPNQIQPGKGVRQLGQLRHAIQMPYGILGQRKRPPPHQRNVRLRQGAECSRKLLVSQRNERGIVLIEQGRRCIAAEESTQQNSAIRCAMREFLIDKGAGQQLRIVFRRSVTARRLRHEIPEASRHPQMLRTLG